MFQLHPQARAQLQAAVQSPSHHLEPPTTDAGSSDSSTERFLIERMQKPQRHRLLHGFPLAAAMPTLSPEALRVQSRSRFQHSFRPSRKLLVGVLPHSFCNPSVPGCGFCTFPHEVFNRSKATEVTQAVCQEIRNRLEIAPQLQHRTVTALYFGGATANLTPSAAFENLCRTLAEHFSLTTAEVTLEGVPRNFTDPRTSLLDILMSCLPARRFRLSMGIQTFDRQWLKMMGRQSFGDQQTVEEVIAQAHSAGMTVSGDLLFNLPGQSLSAMLDDLRTAVELKLDQICLYHLVMFRGLRTEWSKDASLLAELPTNSESLTHWLELQAFLRSQGYEQKTLTNFEHVSARCNQSQFDYEPFSFRPQEFDMLGFGPSGVSLSINSPRPGSTSTGTTYSGRVAFKTMNPEHSDDYLRSISQGGHTGNRYYEFSADDLKILYMTRWLAAISLSGDIYRDCFAGDIQSDLHHELRALTAHGLIEASGTHLRPTNRGMFYADSIAALLSSKLLTSQRRSERSPSAADHSSANDNVHQYM